MNQITNKGQILSDYAAEYKNGNRTHEAEFIKIFGGYIEYLMHTKKINPNDREDVKQECFLVMFEKIKDFDETKSAFTTYMYPHLIHIISLQITGDKYVPTWKTMLKNKNLRDLLQNQKFTKKQLKEELRKKHPELSEIAINNRLEGLYNFNKEQFRIDDPYDRLRSNPAVKSLDLVPDAACVEERVEEKILLELVAEYLKNADPKRKEILLKYFGFDEKPQTLKSLAVEYHLSTSAIRKIINKELTGIKDYLDGKRKPTKKG